MPGSPSLVTLARQGESIELLSAEAIRVSSDKPVLVAEVLRGEAATPSGQGDPSLTVTPATSRFRTAYSFYAHPGYNTGFVTVVAPMTATLILDGAPVPALMAIGVSGFGSRTRHSPSRATAIMSRPAPTPSA